MSVPYALAVRNSRTLIASSEDDNSLKEQVSTVESLTRDLEIGLRKFGKSSVE